MEKVKMENPEGKKSKVKPVVEGYYKFKTTSMARIKGNFMKGGFNISKNKVLAVIENLEELKKFANGDYDKQIDDLGEDEMLKL